MGTSFSDINPVRLRNYRHYLADGKGYAEYGHSEKDKVFVALIVGEENRVIESQDDYLDIDSIILSMAEHIKAQRRPKKKAVKKKVAKKKVKKKAIKRKSKKT